MEEGKDKCLWKIAKKRVAFRRNFFMYILANALVWVLWYFTGGEEDRQLGLPWPAWLTLGWGVGLAFSYYDAFHASRDLAVEREYEKLTRHKNL
ncbi:2TM domain-containing protein [Rufibacter glacialis]|nr:2TM domain-containing protein [Rufibacter glacialis]